jgi:perosamine synthetase
MGLASIDNSMHMLEVDNVAKWSDSLPRNTFSNCLAALLTWAKKTMYVEGFTLRVFSNNSKAISFYKKNSFLEARGIPMRVDDSSSNDFVNVPI